jgi:hypothetical protein
MEKRLYAIIVLGWLFAASPVSGLAQAGEEIGIDRSNLTRESGAVQEKTLHDIHALRGNYIQLCCLKVCQSLRERSPPKGDGCCPGVCSKSGMSDCREDFLSLRHH